MESSSSLVSRKYDFNLEFKEYQELATTSKESDLGSLFRRSVVLDEANNSPPLVLSQHRQTMLYDSSAGKERREKYLGATSSSPLSTHIRPINPSADFRLGWYFPSPAGLRLFKQLLGNATFSILTEISGWECYFYEPITSNRLQQMSFKVVQPEGFEIQEFPSSACSLFASKLFYIHMSPMILPSFACKYRICLSFLYEYILSPNYYFSSLNPAVSNSLNASNPHSDFTGAFCYLCIPNSRQNEVVIRFISLDSSEFVQKCLVNTTGKFRIKMQVIYKSSTDTEYRPYAIFYSPHFFMKTS